MLFKPDESDFQKNESFQKKSFKKDIYWACRSRGPSHKNWKRGRKRLDCATEHLIDVVVYYLNPKFSTPPDLVWGFWIRLMCRKNNHNANPVPIVKTIAESKSSGCLISKFVTAITKITISIAKTTRKSSSCWGQNSPQLGKQMGNKTYITGVGSSQKNSFCKKTTFQKLSLVSGVRTKTH